MNSLQVSLRFLNNSITCGNTLCFFNFNLESAAITRIAFVQKKHSYSVSRQEEMFRRIHVLMWENVEKLEQQGERVSEVHQMRK